MSDNTVVTENTVTNIVEVTSAGPSGPPGGALTIQDNGVDEGPLSDKLNFAGSTVSVTNDTINEIATVTVNAATPGANANITSMTGVTGGISSPDFIQFDTAAGATGAVGRMLWNDTDGTLEFQMKGGNVTLQVGQEEVLRVTNQSGSTMTDGQVVYITGSTGNHLNVTLSQANSEANSSKTLAVVTESIANNQSGFATTSGLVRNLNTSALTEGAAVWLSPTVAGGLTSTKPVAPNHAVLIGWCVKQHATTGSIYVHIANGYELEELHNVLITSVANNQVLRYDSETGLWKNATISPTLTLSGDASGSATFTDLGNATLTVTVADNSHDHTIANVTGLQTALDLKAPLASPTFTGTVTLPSTTSVGTVSATEISYLDGVTSAIQSQIDAKLPSASYTAADVLTKIKTVDGAGSGLDADLLDGQSSAYYTAINDRLGYTAENAANKGIAGGYASLDGSGLVPSTQLPYAGTVTSVSGAGTVNGLTLTGTVTSSGSLTLGGTLSGVNLTTQVTGTLPVANGGTGATTLTGYVKGNGTSAMTASSTIPTSDLSGTISLTTQVSGTLPVANGGTGQSSYTTGDLLYASGATALSKLADVATGNALISGGVGVAPAWGKIGLTTHVSGTLPTANGGTNLTSFTSSGIVYASSTSALATGSGLTFDGTNFATTGTASATRFNPTGASATGTGMNLPASNTLGFTTNGSERLRITSGGQVFINSTTDGAAAGGRLHITGGASQTAASIRCGTDGTPGWYFTNSAGTKVGDIVINTASTAYNTTSDERLKENITDAEDAADLIDAIRIRQFDWKSDGSHQRYGVIAQELLEVAPEAVSVPFTEGDMMGVDYSKLVPMLIKEMQSLRARVAELEGK